MKARIVSIKNGLQEFDEVEMIRVKSQRHTLLIMQNYMPVIGELDGYVELVFENHTSRLEGLKGYFMHKKNLFSLIVEEGDTTPVEVEEETYAG
ncbi:MAG: hypothetical protein IJ567_05275 [Lachnospiraceae bacterium]|nr:hypothetical protein [Lachnospiraceae bacterium]